jgi:phospholipase/carboxylesterase
MSTADSARDSAAGQGVLDAVEITSGSEPTAAVIWLHGLGADGHDFEPLVPWLDWPGAPSIRYVFPHAPVRPVTINGGMQMRAWYDILAFDIDRDQDEQGILDSIAQANALVAREQERGIDASRILLAGFSQGGAIAMQCALRYPDKLAGLVALSTYMLQEHRLEAELSEANRGMPVFYGHGDSDPIVPVRLGQQAAAKLEQLGHPVEWRTYPMQHSVSPEEIQHLAAWMQKRF